MYRKFTDFYTAWYWLNEHPYFNDPRTEIPISIFSICYDVIVVKVNPRTNSVSKKKHLNTKIRIWIEAGPYKMLPSYIGDTELHFTSTHDWKLDCGGDTFEEAIIELANLVFKHHGTYEPDIKTFDEMFPNAKDNS